MSLVWNMGRIYRFKIHVTVLGCNKNIQEWYVGIINMHNMWLVCNSYHVST